MYIGKLPEFAIHPSKFFSGNGTAMTITLDHAPPNRASILVFIDGVRQDTNAYTISGTSLTFTGTVPSGTDNIQVIHLGVTASAFVPDVDTIVTNMLTNGSVTSPKLDTNIDITGNLTVDTDTLYVDSANDRVGIGTNAPAERLEVKGNVKIVADPSDGTTQSTLLLRGNTGQTLTLKSVRNGIAAEVTSAYDLDIKSGNSPLAFWTNGSEKMTIISSGNVGIGTSSPYTTLQIVGNMSTKSTNGLFYFSNSSSTTINTNELGVHWIGRIDTANYHMTTNAGGFAGQAGTLGIAGKGGITFGTCTTSETYASGRMIIDENGNVGIGTTQPQRSLVNKGQRRIISSDAVSYDENRWFTHEAHYNIAGVTNTAWTNLVTWQPYLNGTSNNPGANSLWTRVLIEVRAGGHSSAVGSGDIHAIYSADYNGSGCSGVATKNTLFNDAAAPDIGFAISGWSVTLQIRGASGTTGSLGGYCYVKIHFGGGEGVSGEAYEWSVTDYE